MCAIVPYGEFGKHWRVKMTERKWTKGPWIYEDGSKSCHCCFTGTIYVKTGPNKDGYDIVAETLDGGIANAHLIAAAPDLYEALEDLHNALDRCVDLTPCVMRRAMAALAKARGEA